MKRLIACILLAAVFVLCISAFGTGENVYYTAVNDTLLDLSDDTMPVKLGSTIYVPYATFANNTFKIYYVSNASIHGLVSGASQLFFDMNTGTCYDQDGNEYSGKAVYRNSSVYVPARLVSSFFGLSFSTVSVDSGMVVRICNSSAQYSDDEFVSLAARLMDMRLEDYIKSHTEVSPTASDNSSHPNPTFVPETPTVPIVTPRVSAQPTYEDVTVYLCFKGLSESSDEILDVLHEESLTACFFVSEDDIRLYDDTVRRIVGSGHSIGFSEYSEKAEELLFEAARTKTVLTMAEERENMVSCVADITVADGEESNAEQLKQMDSAVLCFENTGAYTVRKTMKFLRSNRFMIKMITEIF